MFQYNILYQIKPFRFNSVAGKRILSIIQRYNRKKYWSRRAVVVNPDDKTRFFKNIFLYYIKKIDAWHGCSFGTNVHSGAFF